MKQIREYRNWSQADVARLLGISPQAYGKKERDESDGFSPEDFVTFLGRARVDARWLFGQVEGPIQAADLDNPANSNGATELKEVVAEYKAWKESFSKDDQLALRLRGDVELKEAVELLIANRGMVSRVVGYIEGRVAQRVETLEREPEHRRA